VLDLGLENTGLGEGGGWLVLVCQGDFCGGEFFVCFVLFFLFWCWVDLGRGGGG